MNLKALPLDEKLVEEIFQSLSSCQVQDIRFHLKLYLLNKNPYNIKKSIILATDNNNFTREQAKYFVQHILFNIF